MSSSWSLRRPMRRHVVAAALSLACIGSLAIDIPRFAPMFSGPQFYEWSWRSMLPKPWVQLITLVPAPGWLLLGLLFASLFLANGFWSKGKAQALAFVVLVALTSATFAAAKLAVHGVSEVFGFAEENTRIEVSGTGSKLTTRFRYCSSAAAVPPVEFVIINHVRSDGTGERVCQLDRINGRGPTLDGLWNYDETPANYRRTGCAELTPGKYVVGAGAVGDAIRRFEIRTDGRVAQLDNGCPEPRHPR